MAVLSGGSVPLCVLLVLLPVQQRPAFQLPPLSPKNVSTADDVSLSETESNKSMSGLSSQVTTTSTGMLPTSTPSLHSNGSDAPQPQSFNLDVSDSRSLEYEGNNNTDPFHDNSIRALTVPPRFHSSSYDASRPSPATPYRIAQAEIENTTTFSALTSRDDNLTVPTTPYSAARQGNGFTLLPPSPPDFTDYMRTTSLSPPFPPPDFNDHVTTTSLPLPFPPDFNDHVTTTPFPFPDDSDNWNPPDFFYELFPERFDENIVSPFNLTGTTADGDGEAFWRQLADAYFDYCGLSCKSGDTERSRGGKDCGECHCDDACFVYEDCCPDKYAEAGHGPVRNFLWRNTRCTRTSHGIFRTREYWMVTACPENTADPDATRGCECEDTHWNFTQPVLDAVSFLTYRNKYCAACNGVTNTIPWDAVVQLHDPSSIAGLTTPVEIFKKVMEDDVNEVLYNCSESLHSHCRPCTTEISRCNETGDWAEFDPFVLRACVEIYAPASQWDNPFDETRYRNPFCYLCNTWYTWGRLLNKIDMPGISGPPDVPPLLLMLDLSDHSPEGDALATEKPVCPDSQVYDQYTSSCRRVYCAPGREFISSGNGSCHSTFQHTNVYGYRFCLQTTTADFVNIRHYHLIWEHLRDFYYRSWDILDIFGLVMTSADLFKFPLEQFVETDLDALLLITNFIASKPFDRDVIDRAIMGNLSDITDTLSAHMNTSELRMAPTCSQLAFKVLMNIDNAAHPVSGVAGEHVLFMDYQTIDRADVTEFVPVTEHLTCPAVQLDPHQYSFDLRAGELYLNQSGRRVTGPYFYITDKLTALVCWKQYGGVVAQQAEVDKNRDDVLLIVDRVFVAVSLFFLVVSFVLYCLLPGLRSIAGINNMVLIVSLFCAQAFLHVGSYVPLNDWLCQAVGVATHFLWLCVVFAQNTCMFHMFYTLSFPLRSHAANTKVRAMVTRYVVYVLTASFVFVLAGLVWQFVSEGNSGYGGNGCFIRKSIVRISTFAVPLGLTVVANVAMFVFTIARLRALPSVSSTHSNRISMLLYTKLSVFTGVTWLFGFLATGLGSVEFSYVFVVLQDCQGLFVFLAFFANKRVLAMVSELRAKKPGRGTMNHGQKHSSKLRGHVLSQNGSVTQDTVLTT
ncbi:hypothetical protein BaRGS_00010030 [Batillaria attramentaria]|uniref:G-protein coupled receptors family 2 profile 2 domain-containing protein n=1 Tax=Batillaria attramentaria TaxID=370345 RepID=A0ABD0LGX6_9CAEN